jgi:hypothetical protein
MAVIFNYKFTSIGFKLKADRNKTHNRSKRVTAHNENARLMAGHFLHIGTNL